MPRWKKEMGYVGDWWPDGAASPFRLTANDIAEQCRIGNEKIAAGIPIPLFKEHQDVDEATLSLNDLKAGKVANTLGFPDRFFVEDGILVAEGEALTDEDATTLLRNKFASPQFRREFRDGTGKTWPGWSITHLAVTPMPVQVPQKPFEILAPVAMSSLAGNVLRLSNDPARCRLAKDMPESKPDDAKAGDNEIVSKIIAEAAKAGIIVPEDTNPTNFAERILTAFMTFNAARNQGQQGEPKMQDQAQTLQFSQLQTENQELRTESETLKRENFSLRQDGLRSRIHGLVSPVRRVQNEVRDALLADLDKVQFSMGGPSPLAGIEQAVGYLEKGKPLDKAFFRDEVGMSNIVVHEPPAGPETDKERAERLAKEAETDAAKFSRGGSKA